MRNKLKRVVIVFFAVFSLSLTTPSANAETNCRQVARDIQREGGAVSQTDPSGNSTVKVFNDALISFPECKSEIETLFKWNQERMPWSEFPFPESGDPKDYPFGPIGWWWDFIYNQLFDGSTLLMFLFGWELFLAPIPFVLILIYIPFQIVANLIRRSKRKDSEKDDLA